MFLKSINRLGIWSTGPLTVVRGDVPNSRVMKIELALSYCSLPPLSLVGFCLTDLASWMGSASIVSAFNYNQRLSTKNASEWPTFPLIPFIPIFPYLFICHIITAINPNPSISLVNIILILVNEDRQVPNRCSRHLLLLPHQFPPSVENVSNLSFRFTEQYPLKGKNTTSHYF